jgi:hypothetical protein
MNIILVVIISNYSQTKEEQKKEESVKEKKDTKSYPTNEDGKMESKVTEDNALETDKMIKEPKTPKDFKLESSPNP